MRKKRSVFLYEHIRYAKLARNHTLSYGIVASRSGVIIPRQGAVAPRVEIIVSPREEGS